MPSNLKDFFLATPMTNAEYVRVLRKQFPADIIRSYKLTNLVAPDGYIYIKIKKGTYGLNQAANLAYQNLAEILSKHGFNPIPQIVSMWKDTTRSSIFCLCVDNFGIK